jgi:hypothetical protein
MKTRYLCACLVLMSVVWSSPRAARAQGGIPITINDEAAGSPGAKARFACVCTCSGIGGTQTVIFDKVTEKKACKKLSNGKKSTPCLWQPPKDPSNASKTSGPIGGKTDQLGAGELTNCELYAIPDSLADIFQPR